MKIQMIDLLILLNKKFPSIKTTEGDYNKNIKIENLFVETYQQNIVTETIEETILQVNKSNIIMILLFKT